MKDGPIPATEKSGVHELSCGECQSIYIGQTGRKLKTRIAEHRTKININSTNDNDTDSDLSSISAVALHCASTGYDRNKINGRLLHACNKSTSMNRLEEVETIKASKSAGPYLLNDLSATFINPFIRFFMKYQPNPTQLPSTAV